MDDYLTLLLPFLGGIIGAIIALAGAYLIERQHYARELRERIYGPMFMETSKMLENVKSFQSQGIVGKTRGLMDDYLFFTIGENLKKRWPQLMDKFGKYQTVQQAAESIFYEISKQEVASLFGLNVNVSYDCLRLLVGPAMAKALDLKSAVFLQLAPRNFIKKGKEEYGENVQVDVIIEGRKGTLSEFESLYTSTLAKMEKEQLYLTEREQRKRLIAELERFLKQTEPFVKPKHLFSKVRFLKERTSRKGVNGKERHL
jgi:hypothetical protein